MNMDPNTTPAMDPPDGIDSNFKNPPDRMPAVITSCTIVLFVMTVFVAARLFVKTRLMHDHHTEDYLCYFAWAAVVTYTGILIYIEDYGLSRHQWDISMAMMSNLIYHVNIIYCIYPIATLAAKLSVLFQIKRIFTAKERGVVYWVTIVSMIANAIFYIGLFFAYVFQCSPRRAIYDFSVQGKCISPVKMNLAGGILNLISDVETLLLPAWAIWHLRMPIKKKLSVFAVFGVGSIACFIGTTGIILRHVLLPQADFSWIATSLGLLVVAEMAVVVIVGCCPSLPHLYHYLRGSPRSLRYGNSYQSTKSLQKYTSKKSGSSGVNSMAKYMGPGPTISVLGSTGSHEHLELHHYASDLEQQQQLHKQQQQQQNTDGNTIIHEESYGPGIYKTTQIEQQVTSNNYKKTNL